MLTLRTNAATTTISPYGAQVMSFIPHGQPDVLWQTTENFLAAAVANTKAMRGGLPLCWPWFLSNPDFPTGPSHGLGRILTWNVTSHTESPIESTATLTCTLDGTHPAWPHKTLGELTVTLTDTLTVSLKTTNLSTTPFRLAQALHSYFAVADIHTVQITDLTNLKRRHVSSGTPLPPHSGPFKFTEETEHLVGPTTTLTLTDPTLGRTITVTNSGSSEFVIWNPWAEKATKLDMPPASYQHMLCLEAATLDAAPTLQPNQSHTLTTLITSRNL